MALNRSRDSGRTWSRVGAPFELGGQSHIRIAGRTIFVFTGRQLLSSVDEGELEGRVAAGGQLRQPAVRGRPGVADARRQPHQRSRVAAASRSLANSGWLGA